MRKTKLALSAQECYLGGVPGLLPKIDGIHAVLFHVEHSTGELWYYRWRIIGDWPAPYLVWREATAKENMVRITSEIRDCAIEVEWRSSLDAPWGQVALLTLDYARAEFSVVSDDGFSAPEGFVACAAVRDDGVAAYRFPAMELEPGFEGVFNAHADAPALANVLLKPGEFRPVVPGIRISNTAAAENAWHLAPHDGAFQLAACPLGQGRRWFAVGREAVDPALLKPSTPPAQ